MSLRDVLAAVRAHVPGVLEQTGDALGIVDVHLAAVGTDLITARGGCCLLRPIRQLDTHPYEGTGRTQIDSHRTPCSTSADRVPQ